MQALPLDGLEDFVPEVDMVLNTVPAQILNERVLQRLCRETWLLELASAPYGFAEKAAANYGLKTALLPGLPARYAPMSAAKALCEAAIRLLEGDKK